MRNQMICLASLVILSGVVGTTAAKNVTLRPRVSQPRRLPLYCNCNPGRDAAAIDIFTPCRSAQPIDQPNRKQLAIKAKRELLKVAISFERYRIAQRKFPLKLHDQVEMLAIRSSDATWSIRDVDYSKWLTSAVDDCRV
ncbi:hypothetical protein LOC68_16905 [Blastopirellula sp. JC732]|uniref:Secreted protein n=1 Tax=Blastopirellula sediminis TaxID=2894196 RepID=A0A9X1SKR2_9BACT|nr:hypothetical protein [Blastopirellula sediminis]MCC9606629.1 hypothetical protein [Blastopirellula sediminis]MCC9630074.1 hypothetical protein [Blastopirellula sediminis]